MNKDYFGFFNRIFFILIICSAVFFIVFYHLTQSGPQYKEVVFEINPGSDASDVTRNAKKMGLIRSEPLFYLALHLTKMTTKLKAGEFIVPPNLSVLELINLLKAGKVKTYSITIAEGLSVAQSIDIINDHSSLSGEIKETPKEGSLLPDTYIFTKNYKREELILRMQNAMVKYLDEEWEKRDAELPIKSKEEAIILASIIEKETGVAEERTKIAGVFVNRLRKGMRLQTDPTIIYGITFGRPLGRGLLQTEIDQKTEYNTYQFKGLPIGPIANPGRSAIYAALNPEKTEYIYFVANGKGGHAFATTLKEHNQNVANWRKLGN